MSINFEEHDYIGYKDYINICTPELSNGYSPPYAYSIDEKILKILNKLQINKGIDGIVDSLVSLNYGHLLASNVPVSPKNYSVQFKYVVHCSKVLGISIPYVVACSDCGVTNAFTAGTDEFSFIGISPYILDQFSEKEQIFIIGHECGHIASKHMAYHTLISFFTNIFKKILIQEIAGMATFPINYWSRCSEITADRAGLLCCGEYHEAIKALARIHLGIVKSGEIDIEDFVKRSQEINNIHKTAFFVEYLSTHPMLPRRIQALKEFSQSNLYYRLSGKSIPDGVIPLTDEELYQKTSEIVG